MNGLSFVGLLKISLLNLRVNWLRSFLTVLGMIFGTGAVIATLSSNEGAKKFIASELGKLGTNILSVKAAGESPLGDVDVAAMRAYGDKLASVSLVRHMADVTISVGSQIAASGGLLGVEPSFIRDMQLRLAVGRQPLEAERRERRLVVTLGWKVAHQLFGTVSPVNRSVVLSRGNGRLIARVVGVFAEKGVSSNIDFDSLLYMPAEAAKLLDGGNSSRLILATLLSDREVSVAKAQVQAILRSRFKAGEVQIFDAREAIERTQSIWQKQNLVGMILAGVCLLTGGVGIMNVMLLSVFQRKKEVGLRKAIGATDRAISSQFLLEAVVVCFLGGLAGVAVGSIFGQQVAAMMGNWEAETSLQAVGTAMGFATAVGVFFGMYPAIRASRMAPYDALRG